jgi:hypothetical protein
VAARPSRRTALFLRLSSWALALILFAVALGATGVGLLVGHHLRGRSDTVREPFAALQAVLLGVVGLILAFGLALAVGRYVITPRGCRRGGQRHRDDLPAGSDPRRAVPDWFARTVGALHRHQHPSVALSAEQPSADEAVADGQELQRELWALAGKALDSAPTDSAPRLYVESLNEMIDMQTVRVSALNNRVPPAVLWLEIAGAAVALGLLAAYLAILGRGVVAVLLAAGLVTLLLLVTFDLDRPTRGLIRVPATPLTDLRASMELPTAAAAPRLVQIG